MDKLNGCILRLKMMSYWKNIILLGIKSVLISIKNVIANQSTIKSFHKQKKNYYGNEATDFYDKGIPKVDSNTTFLAVISLDSAF